MANNKITCYYNYINKSITITLKTGSSEKKFEAYRNEDNLVCIINPKDFLEKAGYKINNYNDKESKYYEIEKNNEKLIIGKVSCKEVKRTIPYLLNNIYLGEFCEKTGTKLCKINEKEYEVIIDEVVNSITKMKLSNQGRKMLKLYEGFEEIARDPGDGTITIGHGVVVINKAGKRTNIEKGFKFNGKQRNYNEGDLIGEDEADELLIHVLKKFEDKVNDLMIKNKFILNKNQFDAFVLHFYNLGENLDSNAIKYIIKYGVPVKPSNTFSMYINEEKIINNEFSLDVRDNINTKNHIGYFEGNILDGVGTGGNSSLGLARRRVDELELFYYADYTIKYRDCKKIQALLECYNCYKDFKCKD